MFACVGPGAGRTAKGVLGGVAASRRRACSSFSVVTSGKGAAGGDSAGVGTGVGVSDAVVRPGVGDGAGAGETTGGFGAGEMSARGRNAK